VRPPRSLLDSDRSSLAVKRESLGAQATDRLRALIRSGRLPPGTRLLEVELSELLSISRHPIREALRNLEREGLVEITPNRGAVIAGWTRQDIVDLYDVRKALEPVAVRFAAERAPDACARDLTVLLADWETIIVSGDRTRSADIDLDFHRAIWRHANNRHLANALEQIIHPIQTIIALNEGYFGVRRENIAVHERIRDAVASGDRAAAQRAMEAHMRFSFKRAIKQVSS
jgi:DNA-binding GntR family transcriptional regulator